MARKLARCDLPTQQKKNQDPGRWRFLTFPYPCVRALPGFIHRCAVRIPPPPALLFSQNLEQIRGQTVVSFSLQYFFSWGEISKNPWHSPRPATPSPEATGGALFLTRGHDPAGVGPSQHVNPTPPSFSEVLEGMGKTQT